MGEKIILSGSEEELKVAITQLMAIHQMIEYRDIGQWVGYPLEEFVRAKPQTLKIKIMMFSVKEPPFRSKTNKKRVVRAECNVPNIARKNIDWEKIKTACGGANGYSWGRFKCTANLDNGRQMQVHAGSEKEAEQRLKALAALSEADIVTLSTSEEKKEGKRATDKNLYKETTKVYPGYFTIINQEKIISETNNANLTNNFLRDKAKIELWTDKKPDNFNEIVQELLRIKGANTA